MIGSGRVLGVDLGSRRIGVAVSDASQTVAAPVRTLARGADRSLDHKALSALVSDYEAVGVVVGVPYSMSGVVGPAARGVLEEIAQMRDVLAVEVDTVDERLTTVSAAAALRSSGRRARDARAVIDQAAAVVILQSWLDRRRGSASGWAG